MKIRPRMMALAAVLLTALSGCGNRTAVTGDDLGSATDSVAQPDYGPPTPWATSLGGASLARGNGITVSGGACNVAGSRSTSAKGENVLVARVTWGGAKQWDVSAGGSLRDTANAIALDSSGNNLITGIYSVEASFGQTTLSSTGKNDIFVAKVSPAGKVLWAVSAGGASGEDSLGVATDHSGNVFITGSFSGVAKFGNLGISSQGKEDVFVAKLNDQGKFLWAVSAGGASGDYGTGIAVDGSGGLYLTGYFASKATFGSKALSSKGQFDLFVAHLDPTGNFKWAVPGGGGSNDRGLGVAVDKGGVSVTGDFIGTATFGTTKLKSRGQTDVFAARLSPTGTYQWATSAGGTGGDSGVGVATDGSGRTVVTGFFEGKAIFGAGTLHSAGSYDVFIAPLTTLGSFSGAESAGGTKDDYGYAVALDGSGAAYVTGSFKGAATFGKTALSATGVEDIFIWSLGK